MRPSILETQDLTKVYALGPVAKRAALERLTLSVQEGEIFGLVGPNGAGKSTTIKLLLGLIRASSGTGRIHGHPIASVKSREKLGYLPENPALFDFLRPTEFLSLCGRLRSQPIDRARTAGLLDLVGLSHAADLSIRKFSKGMVQRLGLAQALMGDPALVILDEPMSGLDPIGRKDVRDLMFRLRDEGRTVFFSTHILPDVEAICDRVALLSKGKLTDVGSLDQLLSDRLRSVEVTVTGLPREVSARLQREKGARVQGEGRLIVGFPNEGEANRFVAETLAGGAKLESLMPLRENLEELFMRRAAEASEPRK